MSLGFDAIAALPFATSGPDGDVQLNAVTGNQVTISIGESWYCQLILLQRYLIQTKLTLGSW